MCTLLCLQCFDAVGWAAGRAVKNFEWCSTGMVICLERDADLAYGPADATATHCLLLP